MAARSLLKTPKMSLYASMLLLSSESIGVRGLGNAKACVLGLVAYILQDVSSD